VLRKIRAALENAVLNPEIVYRSYLRLRFGSTTPDTRGHWVRENSTLKSSEEWRRAVDQVRALGLPPHGDLPKCWDSLAALQGILKKTDRNSAVLDAGGELYSVILPWLYLYGYRNLTAINLAFDCPTRRGPICYETGDITRTRFADEQFDGVTCLSVIEHGIDLDAFFGESARILKPGGVLVVSTDYYPRPINTEGFFAYGRPVHIFCREEIEEAFAIARRHGLKLTGPVDLECTETPVEWPGFSLKYTYLAFLQKSFNGELQGERPQIAALSTKV
jgi:SAM-dependent methyltransferase